MMPVKPLCVPASRTSRGEDKRGQGLCSLGPGEARLNGVTLREEAAPWDTPRPSGALPLRRQLWRPQAQAPGHPTPLSCPRRVCVPVRPTEGRRRAAAPWHRGIVPLPLKGECSDLSCHRGWFPAPAAALMSPWVTATQEQVPPLTWDPGQRTRECRPCDSPGRTPGLGRKGQAPCPTRAGRAVKPRGRRDATPFPFQRLGGHLPVSREGALPPRFHLLRVRFCPSR